MGSMSEKQYNKLHFLPQNPENRISAMMTKSYCKGTIKQQQIMKKESIPKTSQGCFTLLVMVYFKAKVHKLCVFFT